MYLYSIFAAVVVVFTHTHTNKEFSFFLFFFFMYGKKKTSFVSLFSKKIFKASEIYINTDLTRASSKFCYNSIIIKTLCRLSTTPLIKNFIHLTLCI